MTTNISYFPEEFCKAVAEKLINFPIWPLAIIAFVLAIIAINKFFERKENPK